MEVITEAEQITPCYVVCDRHGKILYEVKILTPEAVTITRAADWFGRSSEA